MSNYTLLLVDDEEEVRSGIIQKIPWEQYGFTTVLSAENGKEALDIIEKTLPDVVITDIKMPFMDGIKLSEAIKENYPMTKVVILTGFDEFEYAQKAIKLNIMEYVLKPISSEELKNVLERVKSQLDKEMEEKKDIELLRENYIKSIPILREKFLISLITNILPQDDIEEKAAQYNVCLTGDHFLISVIKINTNKNTFTTIDGKELLKFAVYNIIEETLAKHNLGNAFINNENIVVLSISTSPNKEEIIRRTFSALEEIKQAVEKFIKSSVTIGVGNVCKDVISLSYSYENALAALDYKIIMKNNKIIWIEDIEPKRVDKILFDEIKEHALVSAIKVGNEEDINKTIALLFKEITDSKTSFKDYQIYIMEILLTMLKTAKNSNVDLDKLYEPNYNPYSALQDLNSNEEIQDWFKDTAIRIMNCISQNRQDTCRLMVEQAKEYVKLNYRNSDISINGICDHLHISPTYFSYIFKKETKNTFINYLTKVRMDAAKELLTTTNLKAFEIAEKVGYSESNYFSYSFKKNFQMSPSEYRNSFIRK